MQGEDPLDALKASFRIIDNDINGNPSSSTRLGLNEPANLDVEILVQRMRYLWICSVYFQCSDAFGGYT